MKKSVWALADRYGQLGVWLLSILPFILFFASLFKSNEFYSLLLVHALGLLVLGLWQVVSTLVNLFIAKKEDKKFFSRNLMIALILGVLFFAWVYAGNFKIPLPATKTYDNYLLGMYFLVVNMAAIRYWKYTGHYYKQKNYV